MRPPHGMEVDRRIGTILAGGPPPSELVGQPCPSHRRFAGHRGDSTNEHGGRTPIRLGHDIEARVHPVHKVHVGDARRPEHHEVSGGGSEPRVGRTVVTADVRLDLHDPATPRLLTGRIADEQRAEQRPGSVLGVGRQGRPVENAQEILLGNTAQRARLS